MKNEIDRDQRGRFAIGNPVARAGPRKAEQEYLQIFRDVPLDLWAETGQGRTDAAAGDAKAETGFRSTSCQHRVLKTMKVYALWSSSLKH